MQVRCSETLARCKIMHLFEFVQMHNTPKDGTADQNLNVLQCFAMEVWCK